MKYKIPGISLFLTFCFWLWQQWLVDIVNTERVDFPWFWLFLIVLFFVTGIVYSDIFNEQSKLKKWINEKRRIFSVDHFVLASVVNGDKSFLKATCGVKFISQLKNVHISAQVTQYASTDHAISKFVLFQDKVEIAELNLNKKYVFATFPRQYSKSIAAGYPYWGENEELSWAGDGTHIVTLKASSFLRSQTEHFLISSIRNSGSGPEPVLLFGDEESKKYLGIHEPAYS